MIVLGGWAFYVVVDEVEAIEAICEDMYVMINFLCVGKCQPYSI